MKATILSFLKQGIAPQKLALALALGFTLGVIPVLGSTTLLCTLAAFALRLNLPAIQLVNGVVYPLQLVLLIPFLRAGAWLFRDASISLTLSQIASMVHANLWQAISTLWLATMHALVVWLMFGALATGILYLLLTAILSKMAKRP